MRDGLGHGAMGDNELGGILGAVLILRPQLAKADFLAFRNRRLRHQSAQNQLASGVQPVTRERVHYLTPNALFQEVEVRRRFRTATAGKNGDDGERRCGSAGHNALPSRGK
jgi:hypothetical protein